jgi:hypothetical protein
MIWDVDIIEHRDFSKEKMINSITSPYNRLFSIKMRAKEWQMTIGFN